MTSARSLLLLTLLVLGLPVLGCEPQSEGGSHANPEPHPPARVEEAAAQDSPEFYEIRTPLGRMVIRLYDDTPGHKENFARLASEAFFDSTTFHRVIEGFMVQGGDPLSRDGDLYNDGSGGPGYTIPAEILPQRHHRRGALAAARTGDHVNPERESAGSQFFIVLGGVPYSQQQLDQIERELGIRQNMPNFSFTEAARADYTSSGGAPHLDGQYTVFGELVEGFDVLDAIGASQTLRKRVSQGDPTLEPPVDQRLLDQPSQRIWMIVRPLPDYRPAAADSL